MSDRGIISAFSVLKRDNAICIQADLLRRAIGRLLHCESALVKPSEVLWNHAGKVALYHYGSFDPWAFLLSGRLRTVFVFHNITPFKHLWQWRPLVAVRALLGELQLRLLPRDLPWFAVSPFNQAQLLRLGFRRVEMVPCIIPFPVVGKKSERPNLLFVGRIAPNKNVIQLLRAYKKLAAMNGGEVRLTIVGTRKPRCKYGDAFERELAGMPDRFPVVWRREPVRDEELGSLYRSAWLYVSTSLHEGFGVPVLEAIAAGTPALYLSCGGTETVLGGAGCLSQNTPSQPFAQVILRYLRNEEDRRKLLAEQTVYLSAFQAEKVAQRAVHAMEKLLGISVGRWIGDSRGKFSPDSLEHEVPAQQANRCE